MTSDNQAKLFNLSTPINEIQLISDYYKAVFHLIKHPGIETERALMKLVNADSEELSITVQSE